MPENWQNNLFVCNAWSKIQPTQREPSDLVQKIYGVTAPWSDKKEKKQKPLPVTVTGKHDPLVPVTGMAGLIDLPVTVTGKHNSLISVTGMAGLIDPPVTITGKNNPPAPVTGMNTFSVPVTVTVTGEYWWRLALHKIHVRHFERSAIRLGLVHSRKDKYVSDETLQRRQIQNRRNRTILVHCIATNELGQEFTLQQLADLSVSNPRYI